VTRPFDTLEPPMSLRAAVLWVGLSACAGPSGETDLGSTENSDQSEDASDTTDAPGPATVDLDCTDKVTAWEALPYCKTTLGGLEVKLFAPEDPQEGAGVAIYLHGDTANGYFEDWGFEYLVPWAQSEGLWFAAVLAPNECSWWRAPDECSWEIEDTEGYNADAFHDALVELSDRAEASVEGVRYVGYSGGSTFLAGHFVPLYGDEHPGIVVANCGGEEPIYDFAWDVDEGPRDEIPMVFTYGGQDFMQEYVVPAIAAYEDLGFEVTDDKRPGFGHCDADLDWDGITIGLWEGYGG
jgi:hypothetical protein